MNKQLKMIYVFYQSLTNVFTNVLMLPMFDFCLDDSP